MSEFEQAAALIEALPVLLRETRRARGLSLRAAADEAGMGFNTLTRLEHNANDVRASNITAALRWLDHPEPAAKHGGRDVD